MIRDKMGDPLHAASVLILSGSAASSVLGFLFWFVAVRLLTAEIIGVSSAAVSAVVMLSVFSKMGLNYSIVKYFPNGSKSAILSTSSFVCVLASIVLSVTFLLTLDSFSPELCILKQPMNAVAFCAFTALNSFMTLLGIALLAARKPYSYLAQNLVLGSKILFLLMISPFGAMGVLTSFCLSFMPAIIVSVLALKNTGIHFKWIVDIRYLSDSLHYSVGNYVSYIFVSAPGLILPIMVLNVLGPSSTGVFYVVFVLSSMLSMVSNATSTSLFVEGSHGRQVRSIVSKSVLSAYTILVPISVMLWILAQWILSLFGDDYSASGVNLLRILIVGNLCMALTSTFSSVMRIRGDIRGLLVVNGIVFFVTVLMSYPLMQNIGLDGVGYGWTVGSIVGAAASGMYLASRRRDKKKRRPTLESTLTEV